MGHLYTALLEIYPLRKSTFSNSEIVNTLAFICYNVIILGQNIHLCMTDKVYINSWPSYELFWKIISSPSIDFLALNLGVFQAFYFVMNSLLVMSFIMVLAIVILHAFNKKLHGTVLAFLRLFLAVQCDFFFIPCVNTLLIQFKYSNSYGQKITEYLGYYDSDDIAMGELGKILSIFFLMLLLSMTLGWEACNYEIRNSDSNYIYDSKISSSITIIIKCIYFVACIMSIYIKISSFRLYLLIIFCLYLFTFILILYRCPYYSFWMNFIKAYIHIATSLTSLQFLIGLEINSSGLILLLFIILQPALMSITYESLKYRLSKVPSIQVAASLNFISYELSIRNSLKTGVLGDSLLSSMSHNFKAFQNKFNIILQSYYCSDHLENPTLAYSKIVSMNHNGFDIFTNFQIFKCKKYLQSLCEEQSESYKLIQYFADFENTKNLDEDFCYLYLKFFYKIFQKDININELKNYVKQLSQLIEKVRYGYESILTKHPSSKEVKDVYGSMLMNLLLDNEKGQEYLHKITISESYHSKYSMKNNLSFSSNRGFLVISGSPSNIGKVVYFNRNFIEFMSSAIDATQESYLNQYLPKVFRKHHDKMLLNFIQNSLNNVIFECLPTVLVNSEGFLNMCSMTSEITGYHSSVFYIAAIDPIYIHGEAFCIVEPNGLIGEHSKNFPGALGSDLRFIEGLNLQEFISGIAINDLIENFGEAKNLKIDKKDICAKAWVQKSTIGSTSFYLFHIEESSNFDVSGIADVKSHTKRISFMMNSDDNRNNPEFSHEILKEISHSNIEKEYEEEKKKDQSQSSSLSPLSANENKAINNSIRVLNVTKILLLIAICVLIVSNIVVLIYISQEVKHINSLKAFTDLSNLAYSISQTALMVRLLDIHARSHDYNYFSTEDLKTVLNDLKISQGLLLSNYDSWKYCYASDIVNQDIITYWELLASPTLKYSNLYEVSNLILRNAEIIINELESGNQNYTSSLFFILYNAQGNTFNQINNTIHNLAYCELYRVKRLESITIILIAGGAGIISLVYILITLYILSIDSSLNSLWNYLQKRAVLGYFEVFTSLQERLICYHNMPENLEETMDKSKNFKANIKFKHSFRYLGTITWLFLLAGIILLIDHYAFSSKIDSYLSRRPLLLKTVYQRKMQMTLMTLNAFDYDILKTNLSIKTIFPEFYGINEPRDTIIEIATTIRGARNFVKEQLSMQLMPNSVQVSMFKSLTNTSTFLSNGIFFAAGFMVQECNFIAFNKIQDTEQEMNDFFNEIKEFNSKSTEIYDDINSGSKMIIENKVTDFIYFVSSWCFFYFIIYFIYVFPLFAKEIRTIKDVGKILRILPGLGVAPQGTNLMSTKGMN